MNPGRSRIGPNADGDTLHRSGVARAILIRGSATTISFAPMRNGRLMAFEAGSRRP